MMIIIIGVWNSNVLCLSVANCPFINPSFVASHLPLCNDLAQVHSGSDTSCTYIPTPPPSKTKSN